MIKFFYFFLFFSQSLKATLYTQIYKDPFLAIESLFLNNDSKAQMSASDFKVDENLLSLFNDRDSKINPIFRINPYYQKNTFFWFLVYTRYGSSDVLLHDKENLDLIYQVLSFDQIRKSDSDNFMKFNLQNMLVNDQIDLLKKELLLLEKSKKLPTNHRILKLLDNNKILVPQETKKRILFFKNLRLNLRSQTGQKDQIFIGLSNYFKYKNFLHETIAEFAIPSELVVIPFLESSFNNSAVSKVEAKGIWQFMSYTSNLFMPKIDSQIDYRVNPYIASVSAFHLLKSNFSILKTWDLAITAYNSGTTYLFKARKKLKNNSKFNLENILTVLPPSKFGFASLNFYAEFLALTRVINYHENFFPTKGIEIPSFHPHFYTTTCSTSFQKLVKKFDIHPVENVHIYQPSFIHRKSIIIVSHKPLFHPSLKEIPKEVYTKKYPKDWTNFLINLKPCNF